MENPVPHERRCTACAGDPRWRALVTRAEMRRLGAVLDSDPDLHVDLLSLMAPMSPRLRRRFVAAFVARAAGSERPARSLLGALRDCGMDSLRGAGRDLA